MCSLDGSGSNYGGAGGLNRPMKRGPRRERDDKVHESIIEERIQRERPCRTLFIRNIKASVPVEHLSTATLSPCSRLTYVRDHCANVLDFVLCSMRQIVMRSVVNLKSMVK